MLQNLRNLTVLTLLCAVFGNLFSAMPAKQVILGAVIKNNAVGSQTFDVAFATSAYLYLYRK